MPLAAPRVWQKQLWRGRPRGPVCGAGAPARECVSHTFRFGNRFLENVHVSQTNRIPPGYFFSLGNWRPLAAAPPQTKHVCEPGNSREVSLSPAASAFAEGGCGFICHFLHRRQENPARKGSRYCPGTLPTRSRCGRSSCGAGAPARECLAREDFTSEDTAQNPPPCGRGHAGPRSHSAQTSAPRKRLAVSTRRYPAMSQGRDGTSPQPTARNFRSTLGGGVLRSCVEVR